MFSRFAGAMFGTLETLPSKSISRDQYIETGTIPDWCSLNTASWAAGRLAFIYINNNSTDQVTLNIGERHFML